MKHILMMALFFFSNAVFAVKVGDLFPDVAVQNQAGSMSKPWSGKKTLVNFWATWCDACKVEMKEFKKEMTTLKGEVSVVFVSLDKEPQAAKDWMKEQFKSDESMSQALYFDPTFKLADALGVESFPMTFIVDEQGKIMKLQDGFKEGSGSTEELFKALK